jgi:sugar phosphate isomerase/epimerase
LLIVLIIGLLFAKIVLTSDILFTFIIHLKSVDMPSSRFLVKAVSLLLLSAFMAHIGHTQEIGLQLYSLRDQFAKDVPGTMDKVRKMGFSQIELAGTYGLSFPEFIKILAENEISVTSYGADYERIKNFPQKLADEARAYGARYIVCSWIPHEGDVFTAADVEKAAYVFNNAGRIIANSGMMLVYHTHGYEFKPYRGGTLFDYMTETFDSRLVQFEMDVFWVKQAGQDPLALLKKYSNRFVLMHLKDRKKGTRNSDDGKADVESNVVLGSGDVGIAEIVREAKRLGIQYVFIEDESSRALEQIPKSLRFIRSVR